MRALEPARKRAEPFSDVATLDLHADRSNFVRGKPHQAKGETDFLPLRLSSLVGMINSQFKSYVSFRLPVVFEYMGNLAQQIDRSVGTRCIKPGSASGDIYYSLDESRISPVAFSVH